MLFNLEGTGKIPNYIILLNEPKFAKEELRSVLHSLCFNHQIVNSAISLPEPIYQADEWAKRGRDNLQTAW